jgi:membrane-bound serine protease (ClpP class)
MTAVGLVLLILGALLAVSEAHNPTHGIAGGGGLALMVVGIVLAISGVGAGVVIGLGAGALLAAAGGGALAMTVTRSGAVRRRRVRGGAEGLIGQVGVVRSWARDAGSVSLQGGVWEARRSPDVNQELEAALPPLHAGDRVVVERLSGLTLSVRPAEEWELL